jgi:MFS family permease
MAVTARLPLVGAGGLGVALGWNVTNVGAIAEPLADVYGVGLSVIGLVATVYFVSHIAFQIPGGRAADRRGARTVMLAGLAVVVAANAAALVSPDLALAFACRVAVGVGTGIGFVAGSGYVRAVGGSPFAQGVYGGTGLGGAGLALLVVPLLEPELGWRATFASAALVAALALLLLLVCERDRPAAPGAAGAASAGVVRDLRLLRLGAVYAASYGLSVVVGNWVVTMLDRNGGLSLAAAGAVGSITLGLAVVTRPLGGWIMRSRPARTRPALALSLLLGALGTAALTVAEPLPLAIVGAAMIGVAAGIPFAPCFVGATRIRPDAPAAAIGLVNATGNLAAVVGTPLLGLAFALPGDGRLGFLAVVALWLAALATLPSERGLGLAGATRARGSPRG